MPSWTSQQLSEYERKNNRCDSGKASVVESDSRVGALGTSEAEKRNPDRVLVRVTSVRKRLLDEDNLCEKYHVDCCRHSGLLLADDPSKAKIEVSQRKTKKGEGERTIIEIEPLYENQKLNVSERQAGHCGASRNPMAQ